ncbi:MAG: questin oxidase family protein [Proteobacteria bacterium]|nr:questin oxidase family protein [Pseudomonadota bacterium]
MNCANLITDANQRFSSQYRGELANHLPMALVALERMGATGDRLLRYRDNYIKRLEKRLHSLSLEITARNWKEYLGQNRYHADYLKYFENYLAINGRRQTLESHLPGLFRGVAGGAFHGLIRLGYALDTENSEEICQALGYWTISYLDLGVRELASGEKHPADIFSELSAEFLGFRPEAPNIARRMEMIGRLDRFRQICAGLNGAETSYASIAPLYSLRPMILRHCTQ